jgi:SHS2 domain-containing protein
MARRFEILEHPADVGFLAYGCTLEELFENAALALFTLACDLETIEEKESRVVAVSGQDNESLLFAWLADILAQADAEQFVFRRAAVNPLEATRMQGVVYGEPFDKARHRAGSYIKAVTYHQLKVERRPERWEARVYLDV